MGAATWNLQNGAESQASNREAIIMILCKSQVSLTAVSANSFACKLASRTMTQLVTIVEEQARPGEAQGFSLLQEA